MIHLFPETQRAIAVRLGATLVFETLTIYAGSMRWRTTSGEEMEAKLGEGNTKDITSQAWRTALDPAGDWIPSVLRAGRDGQPNMPGR